MLAQRLQKLLDQHAQYMTDNAHLELSNCALEIHNELTKDEPSDDDNDDSEVDSFDDMPSPSSEFWRHWELPGPTPSNNDELVRLTPPNPYERRLVDCVFTGGSDVYTTCAAFTYVQREITSTFNDGPDRDVDVIDNFGE